VPTILVEPSATNLVEYSEDFSNSYWAKSDVTISTAPVAAPDGTMTATHVTSTGDNSFMYKGGFQAGQTLSIWARTVSGSGTCYFNSQNGGTLVTVTDQWQRFEVPLNNINAYVTNLRGDSTLDELYIWGAQVEAGSFATSYIPTSGSTAVRAADNLVISGSDFTDFYNQSEGTFYVESVLNDGTSSAKYLFDAIQSTDALNRVASYYVIDVLKTQISASTLQVNAVIGNQPSANVLSRMALSYKTNNVQASLDGVDMTPDTSATMPTSIDQMNVGSRFSGTGYINGHIKRLIYWPYHSDSL